MKYNNIMGNKTERFSLLKKYLFIMFIITIGITAVIFTELYLSLFKSGVIREYYNLILVASVSFITVLTVSVILFKTFSLDFVYKLLFICVILLSLVMISLYFLKKFGILEKIDSVEKLREYVSSFGGLASVIFILIQFLQVVVLPIPAFITVGAGVLLFGALKGAIFSVIGIIAGSIVAFFIGKSLGFKVVSWLVGGDNLNTWIKRMKGKDKILLTFMFLFPFFPDDILCFVAGITAMSPTFFITMIFITRIISVFTSSFSMNNSLIPYDTWWGIVIWIVFFAFTFLATYFIYTKGEKISSFISKKLKRKKKSKENQ